MFRRFQHWDGLGFRKTISKTILQETGLPQCDLVGMNVILKVLNLNELNSAFSFVGISTFSVDNFARNPVEKRTEPAGFAPLQHFASSWRRVKRE